MINKFNGIITPLITPIKNHKIDYNAVNSLIDFLKKSGIKGIFPTGSTGLFSFMTLEMHKKVIDAFGNKEIDLGKMLFMPGIGRNTINETIEIAKDFLDQVKEDNSLDYDDIDELKEYSEIDEN